MLLLPSLTSIGGTLSGLKNGGSYEESPHPSFTLRILMTFPFVFSAGIPFQSCLLSLPLISPLVLHGLLVQEIHNELCTLIRVTSMPGWWYPHYGTSFFASIKPHFTQIKGVVSQESNGTLFIPPNFVSFIFSFLLLLFPHLYSFSFQTCFEWRKFLQGLIANPLPPTFRVKHAPPH